MDNKTRLSLPNPPPELSEAERADLLDRLDEIANADESAGGEGKT